MGNKEKDQLLFIQLILMFQTAAMQHMGKLKNPMTDKVERDLSQAQISIDMLEMLHTKTKSNLSQEEERMLSMVLQELRLNYVDEYAKAQSPGSSSTESTAQS
jgi:hypothetical protein